MSCFRSRKGLISSCERSKVAYFDFIRPHPNFSFPALLVPRASRPCPSTAKMAVARLLLRLRQLLRYTS